MPGCTPTAAFQPRSGHGALRLPGGAVLVAGGNPAVPCQLFDPRTVTWRFAGPPLPHVVGDLVAFGDGGALIAGHAPPVAEVYEADTAVFVPIAPPARARLDHRTVPLADGSVALVGGAASADRKDDWVRTIERYDPATGRWRDAGELPDERIGHTATALVDGSILIAGTNRPTRAGFALRWRPDGAIERTRGAAPDRRANHDAVRLADGRVLLAGGVVPEGFLGDSWLYDPIDDRWTRTGDLAHPRTGLRLVPLRDGSVLAIGGMTRGLRGERAIERFDPTTGTWSEAGALLTPRVGHSATPLDDGRVLIAGGRFVAGVATARSVLLEDCEIWSATSEPSRRSAALPACPSCAAAADPARAWLRWRARQPAAVGAFELGFACSGCLAVARVEWPETAEGFDAAVVEASGAAVRRLRDTLASAEEQGRLAEEVDRLLADPPRLFLLGVPEVWAAARRGVPAEARIVADVDVLPPMPVDARAVPESLAAVDTPAALQRRAAPVPASLRGAAVGVKGRGGGGGVPFSEYEGGHLPALLAGTKLPILGVRGDRLLLGVPEELLAVTRDRKTLVAGLDVAHPERASRAPV